MQKKKKTYRIMGWVTPDLCVDIGTFETRENLHDVWDMILQVFDDGSYPEGLIARDW